MNYRFTRLSALLVLIVVCAPAAAQQPLRWKFQPGQKLHIKIVQNSRLETSKKGDKPLKLTDERLMELDWEVESVDADGAARMTQSFTRVRMKMQTSPTSTIEYDSASKKKPFGQARFIAESVAPLLAAKIHITMTARGQITAVDLSKETIEAFKIEAEKRSKLKAFFSEKNIKEILRQPAFLLPEKGLTAGDRWEVSKQIRSPLGTLVQESVYTYAGSEPRDGRSLEKITVATTLQLKKPAAGAISKVEIKEQKQSSVLYFDAQAGRLVDSQLTQHLVTESKYREFTFRAVADTTSQMKITVAGE